MKAGTVIARKDPTDKRYWQVRANTQMEKTEVARHKLSGFSCKAKADKKGVMDMMRTEKLEMLGEEDFLMNEVPEEEGSAEDGDLPPGLARAPGEKPKDQKPKGTKGRQVGVHEPSAGG